MAKNIYLVATVLLHVNRNKTDTANKNKFTPLLLVFYHISTVNTRIDCVYYMICNVSRLIQFVCFC